MLRGDLQQVACAMVEHGLDLADDRAVFALGGQADEFGDVELVLLRLGQARTRDVQARALQGIPGFLLLRVRRRDDKVILGRAG